MEQRNYEALFLMAMNREHSSAPPHPTPAPLLPSQEGWSLSRTDSRLGTNHQKSHTGVYGELAEGTSFETPFRKLFQ